MATTHEQNERLTRVGPGTPMGNMLRRYWQPIAVAVELSATPVKRVRVLGEDLTLYRDKSGTYGLIAEKCPHRCVSMEYGLPEADGLRCMYHGWVFDATGQCIEQPFEDRVNPDAHYKDRVKITAYPVQELGGMLFAYLGPQPAPLCPRWDLLVRDDLDRAVEIAELPCNFVQCMDNSADPVHFEFLHARFGNAELERLGKPPRLKSAAHLKIAFDVFEYGIMKRRLLEGEDPETSDDWTTGHPLLFPNTLAVGNVTDPTFQFRLPVDDTHTRHITYRCSQRAPGAEPLPISILYVELFDPVTGRINGDTIQKQDFIAWISQGPISDRTGEHLTATDQGVILYHKLLFENINRVEQGLDPMGIIRDPAVNEPMVNLHRETARLQSFNLEGNRERDTFERARALAQLKG
ncbi:MAG: Rieske 2Fe-2S domain-containing protein [Candidatus Lustribacter sp.]|jgi:5,5'-dehydrodivanillate O-demethylase